MKTVYVFPSDPPLSPRWVEWFQKEGYQPVYYDPENPSEVDVLVLITPILSGDTWLTIEHVWKHHFLKRNMQSKLIQAGIKGTDSRPNYLHLYNLPDNFTKFLESSQTCMDNWRPLETGIVDLTERFRLFFVGHGYSGFWHWITESLRFLRFIPVDEPETTTEDIRSLLENPIKKQQFDALKSRWVHYADAFSCLPDQGFVHEINDTLKNLKWENMTSADDKNLVRAIQQVKEDLKGIMTKLEPLQASVLPEFPKE